MTTALPPRGESDRAFVIDAGAIAVTSAAICIASERLTFMTLFVPAVIATRFALRFGMERRAAHGRWRAQRAEIVFFAICVLLGGFNDWNSVVRHRIYDYDAPSWFPAVTTIPEWMLLYWGMILRFFATLARWERLAPPDTPSDTVHLGPRVVTSAALKVGLLLALVLVTRQSIYRNFQDPLLSWLPFAAALLVFFALFRPQRHDFGLLGIFLAGGPLIEILYIQVGGLHRYHLGWLGGVPLWIALWWALAVLVWKDLSGRLLQRLLGAPPAAARHGFEAGVDVSDWTSNGSYRPD